MSNAPEKINASLTAVRDGWYQLVNVKSGQRAFPITSYTRTDVSDARIAELERSRDNWMLMVGNIAAIIPLKDTIGATATLGDMIEYFKGNQARIAELEAALEAFADGDNKDYTDRHLIARKALKYANDKGEYHE